MRYNDNNQQQSPVGVPPPQGYPKKASQKPKRPGKAAPPRPGKAAPPRPGKAAPSRPGRAALSRPSNEALPCAAVTQHPPPGRPPGPRNPNQPPSRRSGCLESCLAALCCCCLLDACF